MKWRRSDELEAEVMAAKGEFPAKGEVAICGGRRRATSERPTGKRRRVDNVMGPTRN